jgi:hypothetical protein
MGERDARRDALMAAARCWGYAELIRVEDPETADAVDRAGDRYFERGVAVAARGGPETTTAVRAEVGASTARN